LNEIRDPIDHVSRRRFHFQLFGEKRKPVAPCGGVQRVRCVVQLEAFRIGVEALRDAA